MDVVFNNELYLRFDLKYILSKFKSNQVPQLKKTSPRNYIQYGNPRHQKEHKIKDITVRKNP